MKGLICFYWIYSPATALHVLSTKNRPKPSDRRILYCTVYSIPVHHPAKNSQKRNEICVRPTFHHSTLVRSLVLRWGRTHLAPLHPGEWWGAWSWGGGRTHAGRPWSHSHRGTGPCTYQTSRLMSMPWSLYFFWIWSESETRWELLPYGTLYHYKKTILLFKYKKCLFILRLR